MPNFDPAFYYMIRNEDRSLSGAITPEPNGAKARFGINSLSHPQAITDGFYDMEPTEALNYAKKIYQDNYWSDTGFDILPSQQLASKVFDTAVNTGVGSCIILLQKALQQYITFPLTGHIGPITKAAMAKIQPGFITNFVNVLVEHYHDIVNSNPSKYSQYLSGWLARASKLPPEDTSTAPMSSWAL